MHLIFICYLQRKYYDHSQMRKQQEINYHHSKSMFPSLNNSLTNSFDQLFPQKIQKFYTKPKLLHSLYLSVLIVLFPTSSRCELFYYTWLKKKVQVNLSLYFWQTQHIFFPNLCISPTLSQKKRTVKEILCCRWKEALFKGKVLEQCLPFQGSTFFIMLFLYNGRPIALYWKDVISCPVNSLMISLPIEQRFN